MTEAFWIAVWAQVRREGIRTWRDRTRVAGMVGSPLVFWLVVGSGFGDMARFFPGTLALTLMFSSVFSMMSLIEDRREGFLLTVMVSPASSLAIALGKIFGASLIAWLQGLLLLVFVPLTGLHPSGPSLMALAAVMLLVAMTFAALGFVFAWQMDSTQGFHAILNLILVPLWMISGALFTMRSAVPWMQWVMSFNPLTYAVGALAALLSNGAETGLPALPQSLAMTALFTVVLLAASAVTASRRNS